MPTLLRIDSSISGEQSRTRALTGAFAAAWSSRGDGFDVVSRDLHEDPLPPLRQVAQHWPERLRDGAHLAEETATVQATVIEELLAADAVLIGAPMYNYGVASSLKSWIDLVFVPGVTAPFDEPTQPLRGKPMVIATAQGTPAEPPIDELVTGQLRQIFEAGCGMEIHVVSTSRTLAEKVPDLGVEQAAAELASAMARASELGASAL